MFWMTVRTPLNSTTVQGDAMTALENKDRTPADRELMSMGYDAARRAGREAEYMRMMNRGGSGGYSARQIAAAEASDKGKSRT